MQWWSRARTWTHRHQWLVCSSHRLWWTSTARSHRCCCHKWTRRETTTTWTGSRSVGNAHASSTVASRCYDTSKSTASTCRSNATSVTLRLTPDWPAFDTSRPCTPRTGPCFRRRTGLAATCQTLLTSSTEWWKRHLVTVVLLRRPRCEGSVMVWNWTSGWRVTMPIERSSARCVRSGSGRCKICADTCVPIQVRTLVLQFSALFHCGYTHCYNIDTSIVIGGTRGTCQLPP